MGCNFTLTLSYRCYATSSAGVVAALAEERKSVKYSTLGPSHALLLSRGY